MTITVTWTNGMCHRYEKVARGFIKAETGPGIFQLNMMDGKNQKWIPLGNVQEVAVDESE